MNVFIRVSLATLASVGLSFAAGECHAQDATQLGKGITGGALLGAEAVLLTEAAVGVESPWLYVVGGVAGAGGGAAAGYYIADGSSTKTTSFLLAGGITLALPTLIAVILATEFKPPEGYKQESAPEEEEPIFDEPPPAAQLGLPALNVAQAFTPEEMAKYGVRQTPELHLSLLRGVF